MKKLQLICIAVLSASSIFGQNINDVLNYSQSNIQGTARFRALSGAFGALGGDMSAVSLNPASSAVFSQSHASFSLGNTELNNDTNYFNGNTNVNDSNFDIIQGGASFVFKNTSNSPWKKFSVGVAFDRTSNFDDRWSAVGINNNDDVFVDSDNVIRAPGNSIGAYFYRYADGLRLQDIRSRQNETLDDAYINIGEGLGFDFQQAFLGFETNLLDPENDDPENRSYFSNVPDGVFAHDYTYASSGYNGKIAVNIATQYEDNLYLGLNLNSHFIDYQRSTLLFEDNNNAPLTTSRNVTNIEFENNIATVGSGFSFQLGAILRLSNEFRVGLTYDSPTWYRIEEERTQFIETIGTVDGNPETRTINPPFVNLRPRYRLQTPSRISGSAAYVFGKKGLLSFDYSRKNYGAIENNDANLFTDFVTLPSDLLTTANTYRLGGEYKHQQFSFRGGYRFEESPYINGTTIGDLTGFSLGLGYNFGNTRLDITYDQWQRTDQTPLYNLGLIDTATIDRQNSNITLTLGFNI